MGKIGRNDPCPCGSGKKYKHCCLNKKSQNIYDLIASEVTVNGYDAHLSDSLKNLYRYMHTKQWWGACHATCSVLYVVLSELGYSPELCIGEVYGGDLYFDHSWIEIDGKIIDLAINMTLLGGAAASGVIIFDKDIETGNKYTLNYGVAGRRIEGETLTVMNLSFVDYMDAYPEEKNGLWDVVSKVLGSPVDVAKLREKYMETQRHLVRR